MNEETKTITEVTEEIYKRILEKIESTFNNYRNILFAECSDGTKIKLEKKVGIVIDVFENDKFVGSTDFGTIVEFIKDDLMKTKIAKDLEDNQPLSDKQKEFLNKLLNSTRF